ncbi:MAG: NAD-binding protein, partial [Kibdelosporangium sp.]
AFVAVTSGDNTNIVGARIAKEDYRVPQVVARIYDPRRADIYRELGIPTVASVRWTTNRIRQMLSHRYVNPEVSFGNGDTLLVRETVPAWFTGRALHDLEVDGEIRVIAVTRGGTSFLPTADSRAEAGDAVNFAVAATALDRLRSFLDKELGT